MRRVVIVGVWAVWLLLIRAATGHGYDVIAVTNGGTLTGTVQFRGTRPPQAVLEISKDQNVCGKTENLNETLMVGEDLGIQNVVVSLSQIERGKAFSGKDVSIDQRECRYRPHVLLVPAGSEVSILNNDGILHNIRTHSRKNPPLNKAQAKFKKRIKEVFPFPEVIKITCDAHAWMTGWIVVMEHPYYAVTDSQGRFHIEHIPAGEYAVNVWHESLPEQTPRVTISAKSTTTLRVELTTP
jgi:plastocyanin